MLKYLLASLLFSTAALSPSLAVPENQRYTVVETAKSQFAEHTLSFTVKLGVDQIFGSGTLLAKKGSTYLVLTNRHVIDGKSSVAVQTHDGQTHQATVIDNAFPKNYDLALLSFNSHLNYRLPRIASFTPRVDQILFTAGYHAELGKFQSNQTVLKQVLPTNRSLKQGYQLGYGSMIHQGMSGGPIIEASGDEPSGELIGINGRSAHPVINNYTRVDGTTPTSAELEQLRQLNWGIPINTVLAQLKPELLLSYQLPAPNTPLKLAKPNWTGWLKDLENRAKQFTVRVDNQATGGNGSGVIVAREGNTYTVLTAEHVLDQKGDNHQFSVLTHDGESHVIKAKNIRLQPGVDLASFQFESEVNYPVATLANYPRTESDVVFVAGFPKVGRERPQWLMSSGVVYEKDQGRFSISNSSITSQGTELSSIDSLQASFGEGYDLVYTSITYRGMSGGPVLDSEGRVVGIHGKAEVEAEEDSEQTKTNKVIQLGNSLGIPSGTVLSLGGRLGLKKRQVNFETYKPSLTDVQQTEWQNALLTIEVPFGNAPPQSWIQRGDALRRLGRLGEALDAFERSIEVSYGNSQYLHLAHFGKARILRAQGKYQEAVRSLTAAVESEPSYTPIWGEFAINYRELNQYEAALRAIDRAIQQQPNNANWHNERWFVLSELERYREALKSINRALELSERAAFYTNRGVTFKDMKEYPKALSDLSKAIEINPNDALAYTNRGATFNDMKEYPKALDDLSKAIEINPNLADAYINRGNAFNATKEYSKALNAYNKAIEVSPNYALAYNNRGAAFNGMKEYPKALDDLSKAIEINPNLADAYINRGNAFNATKEYSKALNAYSKAIEINPNYAKAYNNRGATFNAMQEYSKALNDYSKAIEINPNYAEAYYNRGVTFKGMQEYSKALNAYSKAIEISPNYTEAYNNRGVTFKDMQEYPEALNDLSKAIEINPNYADAYYNRGVTFNAMQEYSKALNAYSKAIEINPYLAEAYNNRGATFNGMKEYPKALDDLSKAIEINPNLADAYINRGNAFNATKEYSKALNAYSKAIEINPNYAKAYNNRGATFNAMQEYSKALNDYSKAIEINPNYANAYINRGNIFKAIKEYPKAVDDYSKAIEVSPNYANAYFLRSFSHLQNGNFFAGKQDLMTAATLFKQQGKIAVYEKLIQLLEKLETQ
ncbi:tetratricopeptide repeat-containing S1 family peptidase [Acaryochloris marina NIES-2412]|uniref:tetratricopeptide repeat-containing S1 family peptidase n=1 Tax=Acaryochloris marina TaxID=155978 RepID=UPI004059BC9C